MYLRIIHKYASKLGCSKIVYVDLYSGPGLAYIGPERDDVILGSPLISVFWPKYVSKNVKQYRGLKLFDEYFFNDLYRGAILEQILDELKKKGLANIAYEVHKLHIDYALIYVAKKMEKEGSCGLVFLDPPGNLDAQPKIKYLAKLTKNKVDLLHVFQTTSIARALKVADKSLLMEVLGFIPSAEIGTEELAKAFAQKTLVGKLGFRHGVMFPISYKGERLAYHVVLAVKKYGAPWIDPFKEWYVEHVFIRSIKEMRAIWFKHAKGMPTLLEFMS